MKSILISMQPYWLFLIIANKMGWEIGKHKTVEVRKNYPKAEDWDKTVKLYCSKDKKSFARIPKEYQPLMEQFLGKVVGEFVCDKIISAEFGSYVETFSLTAQLTAYDLMSYARGKTLYGWHISNLVIYDKPKELGELYKLGKPLICEGKNCEICDHLKYMQVNSDEWDYDCDCQHQLENPITITRPPQSWCYVEREVLE